MTGKLLPWMVAILGFLSIGWWMLSGPAMPIHERIPGQDNRPKGNLKPAPVIFGDVSAVFEGKRSSVQGDWPEFRGPDRDNICNDGTKLANSWPEEGPPILWSIDLGEGHAGAIVSNGVVYILDYDETQRADILRCFSLDNGEEIWRRGYRVFLKRNHGISRTVAAIQGNSVVSMGPKCHLMCVDASSGELKWGLDLSRDFESEVPLWYTGQCPLIDEGKVIVGVGGTALLCALDLETGKPQWDVPNPKGWKMSHASVIKFEFEGTTGYLYCALGGLIAVSQEGQVLFESSLFNHSVVAPTPVYLGNGKFFLTAGYGAGSMTIQVTRESGSYNVVAVQTIKPTEGMASEQQTPLFYNGLLYSIQPKDAGALRNQFVCFAPDDLTRLKWSSGKTQRYGLGPYLVADHKFYILSDEGVLTMLDADADQFVELGSFQILHGRDAWAPMALVKGRLLARDSKTMVCVDLRMM